ncbi:hypothetical protein SISNIDRAFT_418410 [Sistotremastrum niveocremeum HHB9708]|uniref:Nephrocystin 3-like N-terminal domain-containing protein n=1 Tax=Sistotremastrum niveocremeum HHB9708 TaxID=1314777 RepID=A0A164P244_9AGAM|nr:hypothetical protein SISNIDRAFT_418410 [Sistotremastrum niveocremeum HHB9708]
MLKTRNSVRLFLFRQSFYLLIVHSANRTLKNLTINTGGVVQKLVQSLEKLRRAFKDRATLEIEIVVLQTLKLVENLAIDVSLNDMPYVDGTSFAPEKGCLPHTRTRTLDEIARWGAAFRDQNEQETDNSHIAGASLLWLIGFPGAGKSAIAHTIAQRFSSLGRLGSSFFFDKADINKRNAAAVFPKISRDLADLIPEWKEELGQITGPSNPHGHELRHTDSVQRQFDEFILAPANKVQFLGPIFIVIDALDECDDGAARTELLRSLSERLHELPRNFRILVTSRREKWIEDTFSGNKNVKRHHLVPAAEEDLEVYYRNVFKHYLPEFDRKWPNMEWTRALVKRSEGSFQWAFTACRFVLEPGWNPTKRLSELLATDDCELQGIDLGIDKLYTVILQKIFPFSNDDDGRIPIFRKVLGRFLCVYDPLSITDLTGLCGPLEDDILDQMGSLLTGVSSGSQEPVQALHSSFRDFLFDKKRSQIYHVDPLAHDKALAKACLTVMKTELKFNISGFKTSYSATKSLNVDSTKNHVSNQLLYASKFWADHLLECQWDTELAGLVHTFIRTKFLFWLELLALSPNIYGSSNSIHLMVRWAQKFGDKELVNFGNDARKFIGDCADVIAFSPPHLYVSVLPLAPRSSIVSKEYMSLFDKTVKVRSDKHHERSPVIKVLADLPSNKHTAYIKSVAVSPDEYEPIIVSSAGDQTLRLWDLHYASPIGNSITEVEDVESIQISMDGQYIAAGTEEGKIYLLDRALVEKSSLRDDKRVVHKVVAVAPGGRIFTGATDGSIHRFSLSANVRSQRPILGHNGVISDLAVSPNGKHLVSCSHDKTIRVWDTRTGKKVHVVSETLVMEGHNDSPRSLSFDEDGKRLLSCGGKTVCVWDTTTNPWKMATKPLVGHKETVSAAHFFDDDDHIISCSRDLNSVIFSADGTRLLSSSEDHAIRLWEIDTGELIGSPWEGHSSGVKMAHFFDETRVVSAAGDGVIRIWDIEHDSGPLKPESQAELEATFPRIDKDGWVHSEDGGERKLLLWLPSEYRRTFLWGRCKKLLGADPTIIDFSEFEHGDRWIHCSSDLSVESTKEQVVAEQADVTSEPSDANE